jgi:WD40 repeat protein
MNNNLRVTICMIQLFAGMAAAMGVDSIPIQQFGYGSLLGNAVVSPDGKYLYTKTLGQNTLSIEIKSGRIVKLFRGHGLALSPDGVTLATTESSTAIRIWNTATGEQISKITGYNTYINAMVFSPDGTMLLAGLDDSTARLWNVATGKLLRIFAGHKGYISAVAFSPDGSSVLTGSADSTARLWNSKTGEYLKKFSENIGSVKSVAFSFDGTLILTGSLDNNA